MKNYVRQRQGPWALLKITGSCDSDCRFCHAGGNRPGRHVPLAEVARRVILAKKLGARGVILSGGEPTLHPELQAIGAVVAKAGLELGLITNGMGSVRSIGRLAAPLRYVHVSLHGGDREVHREATGADSFEAACETIRWAARRPGVSLVVTTVVWNGNLTKLSSVVELVSRLVVRHGGPRPRHRLVALEPKGRALTMERPPLEVVSAAIAQAISGGDRRFGTWLRRGWDGLPLCLAPASLAREEHLSSQGILWMQDIDEDRIFPVDHGTRAWGDSCALCTLRSLCPGVYAADLERTAPDLRPFGPPRPPTISLMTSTMVGVAPGPRCPAADFFLEGDRRTAPSLQSRELSSPTPGTLVGHPSLSPELARLLIPVAHSRERRRSSSERERRDVAGVDELGRAGMAAERPRDLTTNRPETAHVRARIIRIRDVEDQVYAGAPSAGLTHLELDPACPECPAWGPCPGLRRPKGGAQLGGFWPYDKGSRPTDADLPEPVVILAGWGDGGRPSAAIRRLSSRLEEAGKKVIHCTLDGLAPGERMGSVVWAGAGIGRGRIPLDLVASRLISGLLPGGVLLMMGTSPFLLADGGDDASRELRDPWPLSGGDAAVFLWRMGLDVEERETVAVGPNWLVRARCRRSERCLSERRGYQEPWEPWEP